MRALPKWTGQGLIAAILSSTGFAIDSDGDGMSDVWQARWGISTAQASSDLDGDGYTCIEESRWKTNPRDGLDFPEFTLARSGGNAVTGFRPVRPGQRVHFERSENLTLWSQEGAEFTSSDANPNDEGVEMSFPTDGDLRVFVRAVASEQDADADGLTEWEELELNLSDSNADGDGDGLLDGDEYRLGLSATRPDDDRDGASDGDEIYRYGTDPMNRDTDGDGLDDGWEIKYGLDPLVADDSSIDHDGDGLDAREEEGQGTDPFSNDTDWDGIPDDEDQPNPLSPSPGDLYLPTFTLTASFWSPAQSVPDVDRPAGSTWANRVFHLSGTLAAPGQPKCATRPLPNRYMNYRHWWTGESDAIHGAYYGSPVGRSFVDLLLASPQRDVVEDVPLPRTVDSFQSESSYQTSEQDVAIGSPANPCSWSPTAKRMAHWADLHKDSYVLETRAPARGTVNWLNYRRTKRESVNAKRYGPDGGHIIEVLNENVDWRTFDSAAGMRSEQYHADFTAHDGLIDEFSHFDLTPSVEPTFGKASNPTTQPNNYWERNEHVDTSFFPVSEIVYGDVHLDPEGSYIDEMENVLNEFEVLGGDRMSETVIAINGPMSKTLGFRELMPLNFEPSESESTPTTTLLGTIGWTATAGTVVKLDESDAAVTDPVPGATVSASWDGKSLWRYHLIEGPIFRPDWNRDGAIDEDDRIPTSRNRPFPWLPNIDSDREGPWADNSDEVVNGEDDLNDWFPVFLKLDQVLTEWPSDQYDYQLAHHGGGLIGFLEIANVSPASVGEYIHSPSGIQQLASSAHQVTTNAGVNLTPAWLDEAGAGTAVLLIEVRGHTNRPLELRISKAGNPVARSLFFFGADASFVTPSGDPKSLPISEGTGQNEFVFNDAYPGVLNLNLEAEISGIASSMGGQPFRFEVDSVGDSLLRWDSANQGGGASIEGNRVKASATFEGLPTENSAFGKKEVRLFVGDALLAQQSFEVFFPKNRSNHPFVPLDDPIAPNWFFYWSQEIDVPNLNYIDVEIPNLLGKVPAVENWSYTERQTAEDKSLILIFPGAGRAGVPYDLPLIPSISGIDLFFNTAHHEHKHVLQIAAADAIVGIHENTIWENGWSWNPFPFPSNAWSPGPDGKWGRPDFDDNLNGVDDDATFNGGLFEPGLGAGVLPDVDDVSLLHPEAATEPAARQWPAAWPLPGRYYPAITALEADAVIYAEERVKEGDFAHLDWGAPGKQHKTLMRFDD